VNWSGGAEPDGHAALLSYREWLLAESSSKTSGAIINGDDWGADAFTTGRIFDCVKAGAVSAVSAMVYMQDSEGAADVARDNRIDAGLHLNLTTHLSASRVPQPLSLHQERVASYLGRSRMSRYTYHPGLATSFRYVVASQIDEFLRLYGGPLPRVDGHHHMHLCANVMVARLLPPGIVIRRNFSFARGEKSSLNRVARRSYDSLLSRRYRMVDAFVTLAPVEPRTRLRGLFSRACRESVEIETHPIQPDEYEFLTRGGLFAFARRRVHE
jgi:chitin disaccharide deacetylase